VAHRIKVLLRIKGGEIDMRAYVLIESAVGKANSVGEGVKKMSSSDANVVSDLDKLGRAITEGIQTVEGVQRTTTCLVVRLG